MFENLYHVYREREEAASEQTPVRHPLTEEDKNVSTDQNA